MKYQHAGIEIEFNAQRGDFSATVSGKTARKPSLDAMKKHIDTAAKTKFEPFEALAREGDYGAPKNCPDGFGKIKIIGREKVSGRRYGSHEWVFVIDNVRGYGSTSARVMANTPENRKAVKAYDEHRRETSRIRAERETQENTLAKAIKYHVADDYK